MTLYEIDTLKQSLKKYAVVLTVGLGIGMYLSNCAFKPNKAHVNTQDNNTPQSESYLSYQQPKYQSKPNTLTREEQRLKVFDTYIRP